MNFKLVRQFTGIIVLLTLCSCVHVREQRVFQNAEKAGLCQQVMRSGFFSLVTYSRVTDASYPLHVYIEGDGHAFDAQGKVSHDPTPRNPLALKLAGIDPSPNILYIARPYQFVAIDVPLEDAQPYWTTHRFSEEVVAAIDEVITMFCDEHAIQKTTLIGYSGGGAIAALVSTRRTDVEMLITVAGNVDPARHSEIHAVPYSDDSLNPSDCAQILSRILQVHFVGEKDSIVPKEIARSYQAKVGISDNSIVIVPDTYHHHGWEKKWADLLAQHIEQRP